jgi:hypothetical protein
MSATRGTLPSLWTSVSRQAVKERPVRRQAELHAALPKEHPPVRERFEGTKAVGKVRGALGDRTHVGRVGCVHGSRVERSKRSSRPLSGPRHPSDLRNRPLQAARPSRFASWGQCYRRGRAEELRERPRRRQPGCPLRRHRARRQARSSCPYRSPALNIVVATPATGS